MTSVISPSGDPNEPDLSFSHAAAKVRWAEEKINNLNSWMQRTCEAYKESDAVRFQPEMGDLVVANWPVPPEIALVTGDAVFSLRSALDCCWMGLKRAVDASVEKGTLPRGQSRNEVIGSLKNASVEDAFANSDSFILDTLKPYRTGNETLWFVGQVDNWNKHNMLILTLQRTVINSLSGTNAFGSRVVLENNQFIGYPGAMRFGAGFKPDKEPDISLDIVLISRRPVDERPLMPFLFAALKDTDEAVKSFISAFGKKA